MSLVQNDSNFIVLSSEGIDSVLKLVTDVELVSVKYENDTISTFSEPLHDTWEVIRSSDALLLAREDTRRVDERDSLQDGGITAGGLEFAEECSTKHGQGAEWLVRLECECVSGHSAILLIMHDSHETVCRRLRSNTTPWEIAFE